MLRVDKNYKNKNPNNTYMSILPFRKTLNQQRSEQTCRCKGRVDQLKQRVLAAPLLNERGAEAHRRSVHDRTRSGVD